MLAALLVLTLGQTPTIEPAPAPAPPADVAPPPPPPPTPTPTADIGSADEDLFALENELVSAASRTAEPIRRAPASVSVVTERELRAFDYTNVADAVVGVRGLYETNDKLYVSLGIRGFNRFGDYGNRLQVQMDGHVMNDDWINSSYIGNDQFTDIAHVKSIEVVRGPGSVLYGSGAFFGELNIVTPSEAPPYSARVAAGVVDMTTFRLHADGGHQIAGGPGFWLSFGASTLPPQNYFSPVYRGNTPWANDGVAHGADAFSTGTVVGKAWWGDFTLELSAHQRNRRIPTGHFHDAFADIRSEADNHRGFVELRYEPKLTEWLKLYTRVYVDNQGYEAHYPTTDPDFFLGDERYDAVWSGAEVRALASFFDDTLKLTAGGFGDVHPFNYWVAHDTPGGDPYVDQTLPYTQFAAYALADWSPWRWLLLSAGLRYDGAFYAAPTAYSEATAPTAQDATFLGSLNPRVAAIWLPDDDDTVKLMLGRAYRYPSVLELTYSFLADSTHRPPGPETIYTGELEYRRRLPFDVLVTAAVYENEVSDLVTYEVTDDGLEGYTNVPDPLFTTGAELEARHDLAGGALLAAQVSLQQTRAGDPFAGDPVANSPTFLAAAWAIVPIGGGLSIANRVTFEGGRLDRDLAPVPPSTVCDVMLSGAFPSLPIGISVGVRNVFDAKNVQPVVEDIEDTTIVQQGRALQLELHGQY